MVHGRSVVNDNGSIWNQWLMLSSVRFVMAKKARTRGIVRALEI